MNDNWSFSDSREWESVSKWFADGVEQSPVNIVTNNLIQCKSLCDAEFKYKPTKCKVNFKNNLLRFKVDQGSYLIFKGNAYTLTEITIHTPSLHKIDGESYDAEVLLIHNLNDPGDEKKSDESTDESGIIVSRMFRKGAHFGDPERFISEVLNELPAEPINYYKDIDVSDDWGGGLLLPEKQAFFMYNGSLPFPPCREGYLVLVMEDIGQIGSTTADILLKHQGKNVRPIKPIYDREIFYNNGQKTKIKIDTNTATTDRYLKCVKRVDEVKTIKPEEIIEPVIEDRLGFNKDLKKLLRNIFLPVTILVLFITAAFTVKFLFREVRDEKTGNVIEGAVLKKLFAILAGNSIPVDTWKSWNPGAPQCKIKTK